jgi:hypothetical protein
MPHVSLESIVVTNNRHVSADLAGEAAVLDLERGCYYGPNEVAARIWSLMQEPRGVGEIRDTLVREYDVHAARREAVPLSLLGQLHARQLVEIRELAVPAA